ncbi:hypothetical protein D3C72_1789130 [compost metagenome]
MARIPARDTARQPVHRRYQAFGGTVGDPGGAIYRKQGQQHRHDAEPERQHLRARAQEHQVQAPLFAGVDQHQLIIVGQFVEARFQRAQVGGQ